jgi:tetratricopeptide (TPR) repeat protein
MMRHALAIALLFGFAASAQDLFETTSLLGRKLYALPDDPALVIKLSKAKAANRQYRESVAICTGGLASAPNNPDLYLERGHRKLGLREFKAALADLNRSVELNPKQLEAQYHLGMAYYFLRQFDSAAKSFGRALDLAQTPDDVIDCSNWCYVSLRRAGQKEAAAKVLARITPDIKNKEPHLYFYLQLLHFYQGVISESQVLPPRPSGPSDIEGELSYNTVNYGVGNWHLYNGDPFQARQFFQNAVTGNAWNSWGFIGSEIELADTAKK